MGGKSIKRSTSPGLALFILAGIGTFGFVDRIVVNVLVEPLKREFHLTDTQVSLLGLAFALLNIGAGIIIARYAERARRLTLISFGVVFWSVATAACGAAANWTQLLLARISVGLGEAIGLPSNQSVIADYFPANRRATAISVLLLAPPIGAFIGFVGGGWIAQNFDWRMTFVFAAIPGLLLGVAAWLFVEEPTRGQHDPGASDDVPGFMEVLGRMTKLASARHMIVGSTIAAAIGFGANYFFTSLMMRSFGLNIAQAGLYAGVIASLPAAISVVGSGWLADRLGERSPAAYALIPGIAMLLAGPLYAFAITRESLWLLLSLVSVSAVLQFGYLGVTFASIQNLMHPRMRATASAVLNAIYGIAGGMGPLIVGLMSDRLEGSYGIGTGLSYAMALAGLAYLWAGAHYVLAARHVGADLQSVRGG
ncbi:MAG: MFS transporter [Sphingomonadaceae bacterium]|nr:MFS transporter [Sphingomonadaceae bacterium]